jgi:hypothetical protein
MHRKKTAGIALSGTQVAAFGSPRLFSGVPEPKATCFPGTHVEPQARRWRHIVDSDDRPRGTGRRWRFLKAARSCNRPGRDTGRTLNLKLLALLRNSANAFPSGMQEGAVERVDEVFVMAVNRRALPRRIGQQNEANGHLVNRWLNKRSLNIK